MPSNLKLKVFSNYIVLKIELKQKTKGGLIIPDTAQRRILSATVIATSDETFPDTGQPMVRNVKLGDKVLFNVNAGQAIDVYGEDYLILRETELFGLLEPNPEFEADLVDVELPSSPGKPPKGNILKIN